MPLHEKDKRALKVAVVAVSLYAIFQFVVFPIWDRWQEQRANLALQERTLAKYRDAVQAVGQRSAETAVLEARLRETETGLLSSPTAPLASAELQEWVKQLTATQSIEVRSSEFLPTKPLGADYAQVSLGLQFQCRLDQLVNLLKDVESNEKLLTISKVFIQATDPQQKLITVSMTVGGMMRSERTPGQGAEPNTGREQAPKQ